ncbi:MAG: Gfo/Idh/MocA family oxidoreductase [Erythrobacter sp.]|nr:Gfo/Idh/MocA family oxidoreductase [Erythrobacter sp.]NCQ63023.1 Gfo/Idh/MocA family oxidoreductase [Alphaproteobacteria bacterium]
MGMVGGGPGSFIGPVHRIAAELDREIELVAGAFSTDAGRSREAARSYRIEEDRGYADLAQMLAAEKQRDDGIDFVAVVTPNHNHLPSARAALQAGLPVICDKPMTATMAQARELAYVAREAQMPFALTFTYTGYPLVREMRDRIAAGALGQLRKVVVEYPQGWLAGEAEGKQAEWRVDPELAGAGGCIGDIGVHAFNLAEFVTGTRVNQVMPDLAAVVPGRRLDDDCTVLLRFDGGMRGVLLASQIELGELNGLRIRVYGADGGMAWRQEEPNSFIWHKADGTTEIVRAADASLGAAATAMTRIPGGHPEGYLEAFANLYRDFAGVLRGKAANMLPGLDEGLRSMAFIDTCVRANAEDAGWTELKI